MRPRKSRVNQAQSTPTNILRRKPRTPLYPLRSSRNSPPRFDLNDLIRRGSPVPFDNRELHNSDGDLGFDDFGGMNIDEPVQRPELCITQQESIFHTTRGIVPDYWARLEQNPFIHARISERCFVVQEFDLKTGLFKVFPKLYTFLNL